jgi:hypothetical protein
MAHSIAKVKEFIPAYHDTYKFNRNIITPFNMLQEMLCGRLPAPHVKTIKN